jgi:hypothetical protein
MLRLTLSANWLISNGAYACLTPELRLSASPIADDEFRDLMVLWLATVVDLCLSPDTEEPGATIDNFFLMSFGAPGVSRVIAHIDGDSVDFGGAGHPDEIRSSLLEASFPQNVGQVDMEYLNSSIRLSAFAIDALDNIVTGLRSMQQAHPKINYSTRESIKSLDALFCVASLSNPNSVIGLSSEERAWLACMFCCGVVRTHTINSGERGSLLDFIASGRHSTILRWLTGSNIGGG